MGVVIFRLHLLFANILFLSTTRFVDAYPWIAGHCESGDLRGKYSGHGEDGGGSLFNGSLQVKFDNTALQTYTTASLNANQVYTVTLNFFTSNPAFFYRGLLFRLSGKNGENVEGTFSVGDDWNVQTVSFCSTGISAISHNSRVDKTSVEFNFEYVESTNADLLLEVTVVKERAANNWFYSSYNLQIKDGGTPVTSPPTASPTDSSSPTTLPSITPTLSPTKSSSCNDSPLRFRTFKPDGQRIWRNCEWVATQSTNWRCSFEGVSNTCPLTCGTCETCVDSPLRLRVVWNGKRIARSCSWVENKATIQRCKADGISDTCRKTCGTC